MGANRSKKRPFAYFLFSARKTKDHFVSFMGYFTFSFLATTSGFSKSLIFLKETKSQILNYKSINITEFQNFV